MSHTLTTYAGFGYFNAAAVADNALIADFFVLSAVAFPVLARSEDPLAEQAVFFRFQGSIVNGFRLFYLAMGPLSDFFRRGQADLDGIKSHWLIHFIRCSFRHEWFSLLYLSYYPHGQVLFQAHEDLRHPAPYHLLQYLPDRLRQIPAWNSHNR